MISRRHLMGSLAAVCASAGTAQADVADFYRGKTLNVVVGYGPGGGYDLFARLLARFIGNHIPGKPAVTVQNMPGAASLRATNYLATIAPKDGTVIATFDRNIPLIAFVSGSPNVQYDPLKFVWLGTLSDSTEDAFVIWARKKAEIKTIEDLRRPGGPSLTVGVTGVGATDNDIAVLLSQVLGLRLNIVPGYQDSNAIGLAVENGELDGQLIGYVAGKIAKPVWADPDGPMKILLQFARKTRHPELPDVPTALELAPDATATQLIAMAELPYVVGRPFAAPPGIPNDRARALQDAFAKLIRDPEFLAEAKRLKIDLTPLDAKATFAAVDALGRAPTGLRDQLRDILYGPAKK
jgi:tripartite-type tricarboxylate transporter receptor subunit TctC